MPTAISPYVTMAVHYYPSPDEDIKRRGDQPLAAIVADVESDRRVNLRVYDAAANSHARTRVPLLQLGERASSGFAYAQVTPHNVALVRAMEQLEQLSNVPEESPAPAQHMATGQATRVPLDEPLGQGHDEQATLLTKDGEANQQPAEQDPATEAAQVAPQT